MKKVIIRGPALSRSGYGEHTRFLLRSLKDCKDFDLYLVNTSWGGTSWLYEDDKEREWIDSLLVKTLENEFEDPFDLSIQVTIANEWQKLAKKNIGVTAGIETDKISDLWASNTSTVDKIIVPSTHAKEGFLNNENEITTPIDVVAYPFRKIKPKDLELNLPTKFNFLTVAQLSPRKNIEASLLAFLEEFQNEEDVGYIIKASIKNNSLTDRRHTMDAVNNLLESYPDRKCKVYLLHGNMSDEELAGLYTNETVNAYLSTSHGEGFGLPIFEACGYGLPIIAPNWSGYTDFTTTKSGESAILDIDYELREVQDQAIWEDVIEKDSQWCFVNLANVRARMRELYNDSETYKKQAIELKDSIRKKYTTKKQYKQFVKSIKEVL